MSTDRPSLTDRLRSSMSARPPTPSWLALVLPIGGALMIAYAVFGVVRGVSADPPASGPASASSAPLQASDPDPDALSDPAGTPALDGSETSAPDDSGAEGVAVAAATALADGRGVAPTPIGGYAPPITSWEEVVASNVVESQSLDDGSHLVLVEVTGPEGQSLILDILVRSIEGVWYPDLG